MTSLHGNESLPGSVGPGEREEGQEAPGGPTVAGEQGSRPALRSNTQGAPTAPLTLGKSPVDSEGLAQARQVADWAAGRSPGLTEAEGEPRPGRRGTTSWGVGASSRSSALHPGVPPSVQLSAVGVVCPTSGLVTVAELRVRRGPPTSGKKQAAKSKEELAQEKKKELERRLQDVSGQLSNSKKPAKREKSGSAPSGGPSRLSSSSSSESGSSSSSGSSSDSSDSE
ncbi:hypothetical protein J1605_019610 [Eschrichtius robustus]|uniref:Uncharacterized protein n=1 Tax=Eschrichtius robustus TaxID=9764 RepID=A0AB34HL21_ESCRO|nr:hypothetical protein J1605_019610 [Eschrichtius robustus]